MSYHQTPFNVLWPQWKHKYPLKTYTKDNVCFIVRANNENGVRASDMTVGMDPTPVEMKPVESDAS